MKSKNLKNSGSIPDGKIRKIDPKLRMYANCDQRVNEIRSESKGNLVVDEGLALKIKTKPLINPESFPKFTSNLRKKPLVKPPPKQINASVFVELDSENVKLDVGQELTRKGNLVSARIPLTDIYSLIQSDHVINIESGTSLNAPDPKVNERYATSGKPKWKSINSAIGRSNDNGVLIGIIDVGGFDFAHQDFLNEQGETRFVRIWDQGGDAREAPKPFNYGSEFAKEHLDQAIRQSPIIKVPPHRIERQSQLTKGSHGTHVASIAAGNSGVCPNSKIAGVVISINEENTEDPVDRRKSFYDSASVIHAVDYLVNLAGELGLPLSINISLGTNGHAHDGSDVASRWIDAELTIPGRCVCVAAGNAGQESPVSADDYGFVMGRIHSSGNIPATGLTKDLFWNVVGNGIADISENELEIWYSSQDKFSISLKTPDGDWIGPVKANEFIETRQIRDGSYISIYNDMYHPANGLNHIGIFLSPNFNDDQIIPIKAGKWQVRIHGDEIRNGSYHAWIERDDPRIRGPIGSRDAWNFPSFFDLNSNVDNTSISSLACARYVLSVANFDEPKEQINISSSQGPTRDGRFKPEVAAPGTNIIAAKGFSTEADDLWISMSGTSMASPYVCGVAGLMLTEEGNLTAAQIIGIITRTSKPLPSQDYQWKNDSGYGVIDPVACLREAKSINQKKKL